MSEKPFESVRLGELDAIPVAETLVWRPVRRTLGIEAFGVNAYTAASAGDEIVEEHDETGSGAGQHEELYFVAAGRVAFTVAGEEIDAPTGTFVFVRDPAAKRHGVAREAGSTVLAIGGRRGEPFEVSPWEANFAAIPFVQAGDWDRAAELVAEGLARFPDNPSLLYNLACYEAQAGRHDDALEHLRRAAEVEPEKVREWSQGDVDLDSIRDDPRFPFDPSRVAACRPGGPRISTGPPQTRHDRRATRSLRELRLKPEQGAGRDPRLDARASNLQSRRVLNHAASTSPSGAKSSGQ